jgi:hypothetical protein
MLRTHISRECQIPPSLGGTHESSGSATTYETLQASTTLQARTTVQANTPAAPPPPSQRTSAGDTETPETPSPTASRSCPSRPLLSSSPRSYPLSRARSWAPLGRPAPRRRSIPMAPQPHPLEEGDASLRRSVLPSCDSSRHCTRSPNLQARIPARFLPLTPAPATRREASFSCLP